MTDYYQRGIFSDIIPITNYMFFNGVEWITRCWDSNGMYDIKTQPEAIRPAMKDYLWKIGDE